MIAGGGGTVTGLRISYLILSKGQRLGNWKGKNLPTSSVLGLLNMEMNDLTTDTGERASWLTAIDITTSLLTPKTIVVRSQL